MAQRNEISAQTRRNWLVDAAVFAGAAAATISSFYFLVIPSGRDELIVLLGRETWDDLHTYGGLLMTAAVVIHFALHWSWVKTMTRRVYNLARTGTGRFTSGARTNILIDAVIAISFLLAALSGLYFYFAPEGGYQGGRNLAWDPNFLFARPIWDLIHTWSGVVMIAAAVLHFAIHWGWIRKVTTRILAALLPSRRRATTIESAV
ncbi:MAG: DUF4405 domain-containing protein [Anaerolineae bacterium]|nr:DUF4405 domain-containing protein [Anaerolineae bacterium]